MVLSFVDQVAAEELQKVEEGIRQQRQQYFEYEFDTKETFIINDDMKNCYVNGLPNVGIANKVLPNRIEKQTKSCCSNTEVLRKSSVSSQAKLKYINIIFK